jgi:hypothetical protein
MLPYSGYPLALFTSHLPLSRTFNSRVLRELCQKFWQILAVPTDKVGTLTAAESAPRRFQRNLGDQNKKLGDRRYINDNGNVSVSISHHHRQDAKLQDCQCSVDQSRYRSNHKHYYLF